MLIFQIALWKHILSYVVEWRGQTQWRMHFSLKLQNLGQSEHSGLQQGLCSLDTFVTICLSLWLFDKWKLWIIEWAVVFVEK